MIKQKTKSGFTLIEIMVAVSIFAIVAVITTGALVTASNVNRKAQAIKVAIDNLNFAIDSMALNLQSGQYFHCIKDASNVTTWNPTYSNSLALCSGSDPSGDGIAFNLWPCLSNGTGNPDCEQVIYKRNVVDGNTQGSIQVWRKSWDGNPVDITAPEINIDVFKVFVDVSFPPRAILIVKGHVNDNTNTTFSLENTIYGRF